MKHFLILFIFSFALLFELSEKTNAQSKTAVEVGGAFASISGSSVEDMYKSMPGFCLGVGRVITSENRGFIRLGSFWKSSGEEDWSYKANIFDVDLVFERDLVQDEGFKLFFEGGLGYRKITETESYIGSITGSMRPSPETYTMEGLTYGVGAGTNIQLDPSGLFLNFQFMFKIGEDTDGWQIGGSVIGLGICYIP